MNPLSPGRLARTCHDHPFRVLAVAAVLVVLSIVALSRMETEKDLMNLLPQELPSVRTFCDIRDRFPDVEAHLFVLLRGGSREELIRASDEMVRRLRKEPGIAAADNRIPEDLRRFAYEVLPRHLFLALPEGDLARTLDYLNDPAALDGQMLRNRRLLESTAPGAKERVVRDPLDLASRTEIVRRFARETGRISLSEEGHLLSRDGTAQLIVIRGVHPPQEIARARELIRRVKALVPGTLQCELAGGYAVAEQDERTIRSDMTFSSIFSVTAIFLFFWIVFRSSAAMLRIGLPLASALALLGGLIVLFFESVHPLLAGSITVVAGLGIDFSIHLMTRFRHERALGKSSSDAIAEAASHVGRGLLLAAATTVCVFLSFLVSEFDKLADFGLATALGIFLCLLTTLTLLPALLSFSRTPPTLPPPPTPEGTGTGRHDTPLLWIGGLLLGGAAAFGFLYESPGLPFEPDWRNLRPRHDPAMDAQREIGRLFWGSPESLTLVVEDDPLEKIERLLPALEELRNKGLLSAHRSPLSLLPPETQQRRNLAMLTGINVDETMATIRAALDRAGYRMEALSGYLEGVERSLRHREPLTPATLRQEGLESILSSTLSEKTGLVQLFPRGDLWKREARTRLLGTIRKTLDETGVDYRLTGFKVVSEDLEEILRRDFTRLLLLALGMVALLTTIAWRDPRYVLLSLLPLVGGISLLAVFMKTAGEGLHVMNLIAIPMVIGLGIDDGVHLVHLHRNTDRKEFNRLLPVTLRAVIYTTLTTLLGFGSLALTRHRGISSMGLLTGAGMICCLLPALFLLPAALRRSFLR